MELLSCKEFLNNQLIPVREEIVELICSGNKGEFQISSSKDMILIYYVDHEDLYVIDIQKQVDGTFVCIIQLNAEDLYYIQKKYTHDFKSPIDTCYIYNYKSKKLITKSYGRIDFFSNLLIPITSNKKIIQEWRIEEYQMKELSYNPSGNDLIKLLLFIDGFCIADFTREEQTLILHFNLIENGIYIEVKDTYILFKQRMKINEYIFDIEDNYNYIRVTVDNVRRMFKKI